MLLFRGCGGGGKTGSSKYGAYPSGILLSILYMYIKILYYTHLTSIFGHHNIHLEFSTCTHKFNWLLCIEKTCFKCWFYPLFYPKIRIFGLFRDKSDAVILN